jgi:transcriptional regulator NrdR
MLKCAKALKEMSSMRCPYCLDPDSKVVDSRPTDEGTSIRRRRECLTCGKRFTTYETVESLPLVVVKKDGSRQSFDRGKLLGGMMKACEKRPVSLQRLEQAASDIEQQLLNSLTREVRTDQIGELVMEQLKQIDQVAYVRFASVYRQFKDIDSFMEELNKMIGKQ